MKTFIASGFGAGLLWNALFKDKKGGGSFASLIFALLVYLLKLETIWLLFVFMFLTIIFFISVDDDAASDDPCLLYTSPSPRDLSTSRIPSSA